MEKMVQKAYQKFDAKRKIAEANQADEKDIDELKALEQKIKSGKK